MKSFFGKLGKSLVETAEDIACEARLRAQQHAGSPGQQRSGAAGSVLSADRDPVLKALLSNVRSNYVQQHFFKTPVEDYTEKLDVSVLVGSFNVNGKKPPPGLRIGDWLATTKDWPVHSCNSSGNARAAASSPDVVAVGFQEIVPLTAGNVVGVGGAQNVVAWDACLAAYLNGEEWAKEKYGPAALSSASQPNLVATEAIDAKWSGREHDLASVMAKRSRSSSPGPMPQQQYVQVACKQLVGVYLSVWVRKALLSNVRGVQVTSCATGFGGYLGNKGAVAVRMRVYDSALCVVTAHLAAGEQEGDELRRNSDVQQILQRCCFVPDDQPQPSMAADGATLISASLGRGHWGDARMLVDHENLIWVGDLNYRLNMPDDEVRRALRSGRLDALLAADQMLKEMAEGRVFKGWTEAPITFPPTFKYIVGSAQYIGEPLAPGGAAKEGTGEDLAPDEEEASSTGGRQTKRAPAWCDRILWVPQPSLSLVAYGRGELHNSDHKPVFAAFNLKARHYDRKKVEALLESSCRAADAMQLAMRPKPRLSTNVVQVGSMRYGDVRRSAVVLHNSGPAEGIFHFISTKGIQNVTVVDEPVAPPWLKLEPEEGIVAAGGSQAIAVIASLYNGAANALAAAPSDQLDAILILRVEDGADFFLTVTGEHVRSCMGVSLDRLLAYGNKPICDGAAKAVTGLGESSPTAAEQCAGAGATAAAVAVRLEAMQVTTSSSGQEGGVEGGGGGSRSSLMRNASSFSQARASSQLVAKELQWLTSFLSSSSRLRTPGLFYQSVQRVLGEPLTSTSSEALAAVGRNVRPELVVRLAPLWQRLDAGRSPLEDTDPHEVAALLLLICGELPWPLLPTAAAATAAAAAAAPLAAGAGPGKAAEAALRRLGRAMSTVEFAVLKHLLALLRRALGEGAANGLTVPLLSNCLVDFWFAREQRLSSGGDTGANPQAQAAREVRGQRVDLVALLLSHDC